MRQHLEIRRARRRDIDRILDIEAACFGRDAWDRYLFEEAFADCSDLFFIAKAGGRIAGYSITCIEDNAELISVAVVPLYQRLGVAQALIGQTIADLAARGVGALRLMVEVENERAISLYKRLGFVRIMTVPGYYGKGRAAWRMELRLGHSDSHVSLGHTRPDNRLKTAHCRRDK